MDSSTSWDLDEDVAYTTPVSQWMSFRIDWYSGPLGLYDFTPAIACP